MVGPPSFSFCSLQRVLARALGVAAGHGSHRRGWGVGVGRGAGCGGRSVGSSFLASKGAKALLPGSGRDHAVWRVCLDCLAPGRGPAGGRGGGPGAQLEKAWSGGGGLRQVMLGVMGGKRGSVPPPGPGSLQSEGPEWVWREPLLCPPGETVLSSRAHQSGSVALGRTTQGRGPPCPAPAGTSLILTSVGSGGAGGSRREGGREAPTVSSPPPSLGPGC